MKIEKFEDLECWKEARILVNMVYDAIHSNGRFERDYGLRGQVTDAAVSSMSNIAEGFSRHSNKEFAQFLFISKGSVSEVQSILYVALDQAYMLFIFKDLKNYLRFLVVFCHAGMSGILLQRKIPDKRE